MNYKKTLQKYIKTKIKNLGNSNRIPSKQKYKFFFIIPAYAEYQYIFKTLESINFQKPILIDQLLVIIVINNSTEEKDSIIQDNQITYNKLINTKYKFEFIIIDCFSNQFALQFKISGVGMARKIGMDFCIQYADQDSLFCSLDADTLIHKNYLEIIDKEFNTKQYSAAVVNFSHQKSKNKNLNMIINKYETILKDIANKIDQSGSPYGYVSMGSTIICTCQAYIAIGGIQPKKATEDFYFLQQLAKYNSIYKINSILIFPSARSEQRVYLGTGFRMKNFSTSVGFKDLDFDPQAYKSLTLIYKIIDKNWNLEISNIYKLFKIEDIKIYCYMKENKFTEVFNKINNNIINKNQFINQFNNWFDSLKIYKFLKMYVRN